LYSSYLTYKTVTKNNISVCSFNQLLRALKKNEKFIVFGTPQGLLNSLSQSLPLLIVGSAFSLPIAGQYFLALKVVQLPVVLCASAVRPLFLKEFSSFDFGVVGLQQKVISYTFYLSLIAIPVFLVLFQYSNFIFTLIFGQEWLLAGQIASILCIWLVICFINPPCTALLYRFKQVKFLFYYELALFMFRLCSMYLGVKTGSLIATVTYFVVVGVLMNLILIIYTCYLAKKIETQI
jgi:O-antigen/teichoic acid export membrane protein